MHKASKKEEKQLIKRFESQSATNPSHPELKPFPFSYPKLIDLDYTSRSILCLLIAHDKVRFDENLYSGPNEETKLQQMPKHSDCKKGIQGGNPRKLSTC